jgi:transposase
MQKAQNRHDITEAIWSLLKPLLPGQRGQWGGLAQDNRRFINGVFWILRTGAPWRDLPECYGKWNTVFQRFRRWKIDGVWERILEALAGEPECEWLMVEATHIRVHPHAAGAVGGNQEMTLTKGGSRANFMFPWARLVFRSEYLQRLVPWLTARRLLSLSKAS